MRLVDSRLFVLYSRLVKYLLNFPNGQQRDSNCDTVKDEELEAQVPQGQQVVLSH